MFLMFVFLFFCITSLVGVFGDEVKSVSVMEGDSVTLHTNIPEIKRDDVMEWRFGRQTSTIAKIINGINQVSIYADVLDGRFRHRLQLNDQTGDLIITNITTQHTGDYNVTITSTTEISYRFNVIVYARLPVPVITTQNSSISGTTSSSSCVLLCSVLNMRDVRDVSLSWYKGNSLLSSISVSDLNNSISLHLKCLNDSYNCVVNNPISNQTQHLNTDLCQTCSDLTLILICCIAVGCLMIVASVLIFWIYRKHRNTKQHVQNRESEITYADPTFCKRAADKPGSEDDVVYAGVKR
ncbi:SLAM family member 5-like [Paramisgurnus dabryanus]|uniref:SLAM family member 5-like n=1 Tax=Paramisgurnus dabryanus TaxID=90735 RepID=UPI0031F3E995